MQLTQPTEPQFHRGIWAWDTANDTWVQLQIDTTDGSLHVALKEAVLPTGAATEDTLKTRFGYSDTAGEQATHTMTEAAHYNMDFTAVPADTIHVITNITAQCTTTNPNYIHLFLVRGATAYILHSHTLATAWFHYPVDGWWVLKEGDKIRVRFTSCAIDDVLLANITGFAMDLPT